MGKGTGGSIENSGVNSAEYDICSRPISQSVASNSVLSVGPSLAELNCYVTGAEKGHVLQSMESVLVELTKTVKVTRK